MCKAVAIAILGAAMMPAQSGVVSLRELQHQVPGKAWREYDRALKAKRQHRDTQALEHLVYAMRIDPDFALAHHQMGIHYVDRQDLAAALTEFETVARLLPSVPEAHVNAALLLLHCHRAGDAEQELRRALYLRPGYPLAEALLTASRRASK